MTSIEKNEPSFPQFYQTDFVIYNYILQSRSMSFIVIFDLAKMDRCFPICYITLLPRRLVTMAFPNSNMTSPVTSMVPFIRHQKIER